ATGGRVVMQGGDGGLDLVATGALRCQRRLEYADAFGDLASVPQAAVLPVERHNPALLVESRRQSGAVEEHQREQPLRLWLIAGEGELAGEPDRLACKVDPPSVAR